MNDKWALVYNCFFIGRRLIYAFIVVILKDYQALQILFFFLQSMVVFMYIIYAKPFEDSALNKIEIFNEFCILVTTYHLICFTDFIPNEAEYDEILV